MFEEKIAALNRANEQSAVCYEKRTYTVDEIQDILGISRPTAYNLVKKGLFHSVRVGGHIRISKSSILRGGNIMQQAKTKKSISVPEMGRMLGLGKVESYWLVKKNYFTTIQVAGRMRVMLDSFEDWYAGQFHYKKVDGTPPGAKWRHTTMSVPELAELLGLKSATAYDLVKRAHLETMIIDRRIRVVNDSFESWYAGQSHYIKITERSC